MSSTMNTNGNADNADRRDINTNKSHCLR